MECSDCFESIFWAAILLMTSLHGLLLVLILLFGRRFKTKANRYLSLSLLAMVIILGYEAVYWWGGYEAVPAWIDWIPIYIRSAIPAGIFYFIVYLIRPEHSLSPIEKSGFTAMAVEIVLHLAGQFAPLVLSDESTIEWASESLTLAGWLLSLVLWVILLPIAWKKINQYQQFLYANYSTADRRSLAWLRNYLVVFSLVAAISGVSMVQYAVADWEGSDFSFGFVTIGLVLLLFGVGYFVILHHAWFEIVAFEPEENESQGPESKLSSKTDGYFKMLKSMMEEDRLFEDVELTLESLAGRLDISGGYLSQIIKDKEQKTFFHFVNHYRVEAVKAKLLDANFQKYSILGIAMDSGFSSKSTFNAVFKKFTGQTPSAFRKSHRTESNL